MAEAGRGRCFQPCLAVIRLRNIMPSSSWHEPWKWEKLGTRGWVAEGGSPLPLSSTESYKNK